MDLKLLGNLLRLQNGFTPGAEHQNRYVRKQVLPCRIPAENFKLIFADESAVKLSTPAGFTDSGGG
jgi:hypothetical protein